MRTYRELFAVREFRVLFLSRCVVMISVAASGLAMGTIIYRATGSPVLTGLALFGGPLISLITSQLLLSASDAVRPRTALQAQMAGALAANLLQALPGLPWPVRFVILAIPYVVNSAFSGTQWVIIREIIGDDGYLLARATMNVAVGGMQIVGYGVGGLALTVLSPHDLFLVAAGANVVSLVNVRLGIKDRPPIGRRTGSLVRRTREVNGALLGSGLTRPVYLATWVPNGLVVGCESLFIPYAGGAAAGLLMAATACGMLAGDVVVGRFVPARVRDRAIGPLRLTLAVPYVVFALEPPHWVAMAVVAVASFGYSAALPLQDRLIRSVDRSISGQAMGLQSQGMMIWQSLGAVMAGAVATVLAPGTAMAVMAALSVLVTIALTPSLRRSAPGRASEPVAPVGPVTVEP